MNPLDYYGSRAVLAGDQSGIEKLVSFFAKSGEAAQKTAEVAEELAVHAQAISSQTEVDLKLMEEDLRLAKWVLYSALIATNLLSLSLVLKIRKEWREQ